MWRWRRYQHARRLRVPLLHNVLYRFRGAMIDFVENFVARGSENVGVDALERGICATFVRRCCFRR